MTRKSAAIVAVVIIAALALLLVPSAVAGKGGGKPGAGASASVTASPNPAPANGARVELNGCGYDMYKPAEVRIVHSAGYTEAYGVAVWNPGCLNTTPIYTAESGTYTIQVYQAGRKGPVLKASTVLTVQ
jgi:hypothetical protein